MLDNDLVSAVASEIYMPYAIISRIPTPTRPATGTEDLERISDSYSYWFERALFDCVVAGDSEPLKEFALNMSPVLPYREIVNVSLHGLDEQWEEVLEMVLEERKKIRELVHGRKNNFGSIMRARILGRDYLLESMIRLVERHAEEWRILSEIKKWESGEGIGTN